MSKTVKTLSAANMAFANTIVQQLDVLSVRRKEWEATDYKKANDLYSTQTANVHKAIAMY